MSTRPAEDRRSRVFGGWRQPCSCPTRTQFSIYKTTARAEHEAALRGLHAEAQAKDRPLRARVERFNPEFRLYQRLGFNQIVDRGVYLFMEWLQG